MSNIFLSAVLALERWTPVSFWILSYTDVSPVLLKLGATTESEKNVVINMLNSKFRFEKCVLYKDK